MDGFDGMKNIQPFLFCETFRKMNAFMQGVYCKRMFDFYIGYLRKDNNVTTPVRDTNYFDERYKDAAKEIANTNLLLETERIAKGICSIYGHRVNGITFKGNYRSYGASLFLRKDIRQKAAELVGGDYIVIPSDICCIRFVGIRGMNEDHIASFARKIKPRENAFVLSHNIYRYLSDSDEVVIIG